MTHPARERLWSRDFALLFAAMLLFWSSFLALLPTIPLLLMQQLRASLADVGAISAVMALAAIAVRPAAGYALDRWGRKWLFLASLVLFGAICPLYALVTSVGQAFVIRAWHGVPFGIATGASMALAGDLAPPSRRGEALGVFVLTQTVAMAVSPTVAMAILGTAAYSRVFLWATILGAASFAMAFRIRYPNVRDSAARLTAASMLEQRVLATALTAGLIGIAHGGVVTFISLYAHQLRLANLGLYYFANASGQVLSRLVAGGLYDRRGPRSVVPAGVAMLVTGYVILGVVPRPDALLSAGLILGVGFGLTFPALQAMTIEQVKPQRRGAASATFFNGFDLGISAGSFTLAFVAQALGGYSGMFLVSGGLVALAFVAFFAAALPAYRRWKTDA